MNYSCIIIEDEPLAQRRLTAYIAKLPYLQVSAVFDNGPDALVYLNSRRVDLIFLDINLGLISGIQLLEMARLNCPVIITTAYEQYALKGYELNVADYLLKPFTFERFLKAVTKVTDSQRAAITSPLNHIFIKTAHRLERIELKEILYIQGARDYRRIYYADKKLMTLKTFGEFEKEIPEKLICRIHRSWMISLDKIIAVEGEHVQIGKRMIPLSETYKKRFFELINY